MRDVCVTVATVENWAQIESMRGQHYRRTGAERIPVPDSARWMVALYGEIVTAAAAVVDRDLHGTMLWVSDFYCLPSRLGRLGVTRLIDWLELSDARIAGTIPIWNKPMLNALARRGYYPVEITMEKDQRVRTF